MTMTMKELEGCLGVIRAVGEAIRDLCQLESYSDGVPEGVLYARLMASGINLDGFNAVISLLKDAGKIDVKNHLITWIGEPKPTA